MEKMSFDLDNLADRFPSTFGKLREPVSAEELRRHEERERERAAAIQDRQRRDAAAEFLRQRGARYRSCRLSNFEISTPEQRRAVELLKTYCGNLPDHVDAGNGICLYGPSGGGKDHLLTAVGYAAVRRFGFSVFWQNGVALYAELRKAIEGDRRETDILRPLLATTILILSDPLPPEAELTRYQRETLYHVLDSRYSHQRPTLVSVNVKSAAEASERLGAACHDRLRDGALCIYTKWPSYRRPATT